MLHDWCMLTSSNYCWNLIWCLHPHIISNLDSNHSCSSFNLAWPRIWLLFNEVYCLSEDTGRLLLRICHRIFLILVFLLQVWRLYCCYYCILDNAWSYRTYWVINWGVEFEYRNWQTLIIVKIQLYICKNIWIIY